MIAQPFETAPPDTSPQKVRSNKHPHILNGTSLSGFARPKMAPRSGADLGAQVAIRWWDRAHVCFDGFSAARSLKLPSKMEAWLLSPRNLP